MSSGAIAFAEMALVAGLVLGWGFAAAALLLLIVNLRDSIKR